MKILVRAPYRGDSGYAVVNRNIIISLARSGHELYFEPVVWASNTCPVTQEEEVFLAWAERNGYMNIPPDDNILTLNLTIPELYNLKMRGKNVGWYIFEADRVPERWKFYIDQMDEIITPTKFNADQLIAMGYKKPIHILHEGINPKIYNPEVEPVFKSDKFTFLFVGIAHERKRWKEVISCFFETFKTQEDVRLILKLQPTPHATAGEIEKHIQDEKNRTGSVAEIKLCTRPIAGSLASLYASADCFVSIAAEGWGLPPCFVEGTKVDTTNGFKNIENITAGDMVLTHKGRYKKVVNIGRKHITEKCLSFFVSRKSMAPIIQCTKNHPLLIVKRGKSVFSTLKRRNLIDHAKWIDADNVCIGDFLVIPKPITTCNVDTIDMSQFSSYESVNGELASKYSNGGKRNTVSYKDIAKEVGCSADVVYRVIGRTEESKAFNKYYKSEYGIKIQAAVEKTKYISNKKRIPSLQKLDYDFGRFLGFYISEGWIGKDNNVIGFALHEKETEYIAFIQNFLKERFGLESRVKVRKDSKGVSVITCSAVLSEILSNLCGVYAQNKKIPFILNSNKHYRRGAISGIIQGDGYIQKNGNIKFSTASKLLIENLQKILLVEGILVFPKTRNKRESANFPEHILSVNGKQVNKVLSILGVVNNRQGRREGQGFIYQDNYFFVPVAKMEKTFYDKYVYNITVDCDNSYTANFVSAHNCESIACGCYSILLNWGGFTEWHTDAMGLKVAVKDIRTCENMQGFSGYEDSSLKWAYPDLEDFKSNMFEAYENRVHIKNTRKERSSLIHAQYNWQKTVKEGLIPLLEEKKPIIAAQKPKLSVAMITKNVSGFTVDGCNVFKSNLSILSKLADEIIVVDGNSTDDTVSVAENFGAKVYQYNDCKQKCGICGVQTPEDVCDPETREQKDCFSKFRKASFRLCTGDWIMRLDSEELIREEDIETFRNLILNADKDFYKYIAFIFPTVNFWKQVPYYRAGWDGTFSWFPDNHVRLYKNIPELHNFFAPAHEGVNVPTDAGWVNLINHKQTLYLSNPVVFHYGYLKQDSIDRNSRYEKLGASTHYLGNENYYGLSTVKWESNVPELKYSENPNSSEGGAK